MKVFDKDISLVFTFPMLWNENTHQPEESWHGNTFFPPRSQQPTHAPAS